MKLIGYVRVSTVGQVKDGLGLATQERLIRDWTKAAGHKLGRLVAEEGRSGTLSEADRPGLLDALGSLRAGEAGGLVAASLDRIARSLTVQEAVLAQAWQAGATVFTVDAGEILRDDGDDPMRTFVRQVMGAVAELDRSLVVKRLRNGRRTAAEQGRRSCGTNPYGYRSVGGVLEPIEAEQVALAQMRAWRSEGLTLEAVAQRLNDAGVVTKRGGPWRTSTVSGVLSRT